MNIYVLKDMNNLIQTNPKYIYMAYVSSPHEDIYLDSLDHMVGHFVKYEDAVKALYLHHLKTRQKGIDHKFSYEGDFVYNFITEKIPYKNDFKPSPNRPDLFANCIEKVYMEGEHQEFFVIDKYPLYS